MEYQKETFFNLKTKKMTTEENKIITIEQLKFAKQQHDYFKDMQEKYKAVQKVYKSKDIKQSIKYWKIEKEITLTEILNLIEKL